MRYVKNWEIPKTCTNFAFIMKRIENCRLKEYNTFGIEANADCLVEFSSEDELRDALDTVTRPLLVVGGGSNLLFLNDFHGTVLHSAVRGMEIVSETSSEIYVKVGSGVKWDDFVNCCVERGWWGAENLSAIPGEVGASAVQNIGAYGAEAKDIISEVRALSVNDGSLRIFSVDECGYGYRDSVFKKELKGQYVVTYVTYRLYKTDNPNVGYGSLKQAVAQLGGESLRNIREAVIHTRASKLPDPKVLGNAGSFFMNPVISEECFRAIAREYPDVPSYPAGEGLVKVPAGWLIEKCGWKGRGLGPAAVHERQALVLVNRGAATGADIKALADAVICDVKSRFNITLKTEVNYIM